MHVYSPKRQFDTRQENASRYEHLEDRTEHTDTQTQTHRQTDRQTHTHTEREREREREIRTNRSPTTLVSRATKLFRQISQKYPFTPIYLSSMYPVSSDSAFSNLLLTRFNVAISFAAAGDNAPSSVSDITLWFDRARETAIQEDVERRTTRGREKNVFSIDLHWLIGGDGRGFEGRLGVA